jgi:TonB family protein
MPLNVRRFGTSVIGFLLLVGVTCFGQVVPAPSPNATAGTTPAVMGPPTSGDIMRDRISKSKAYIAVRNYNAAIYELENIRKESGDSAVQGVVNLLLMNSYLEQGDFKRAQDLLNQFYVAQKTTKPSAATEYAAIAGQIIKGARTRAERYQALGLSLSDRTLPLEALNDLEKMRETLEMVITQAKEIGANKNKAADAMAMLEEASNSRAMIARDTYDARRWKDELADTRETMASSRSVVMSAVEGESNVVATNTGQPAASQPPVSQPMIVPVASVPQAVPPVSPGREREVKIVGGTPSDTSVAQTEKPVYVPEKQAAVTPPKTEEPKMEAPKVEAPTVETPKAEPKPELKAEEPKAPVEEPKTEAPKNTSPVAVGSLIGFATSQAKPIYPPAAKAARSTGVVTVELTVDETGGVVDVQKATGPMMLQAAAKDAIRKWKFKPFLRDGQPVKATGFVNFNFAL